MISCLDIFVSKYTVLYILASQTGNPPYPIAVSDKNIIVGFIEHIGDKSCNTMLGFLFTFHHIISKTIIALSGSTEKADY